MTRLLQLAQDLEWQVIGLDRAALSSAPGELDPVIAKAVDDRRQALLVTAAKIQNELLSTVRFSTLDMLGVGEPIHDTLDSVAALLEAIDEVRQNSDSNSGGLASRVRSLMGMLHGYCDQPVPAAV